MRLQEYSINIIHKAGKDHCNADTLSRIVESMCAISDEAEVLDGEKIRKLQETDAEISRLRTRILAGEAIKNFKVVDGILFCKLSSTKSYDPDGQYRLVVPQGLIGDVLQTCHDDIGGAHLGVNKTWQKVSQKFYWSTMQRDVEEWVESCPICAARKSPQSTQVPLGSITHPEKPFDTIGIDFLGPLTETDSGNKYVLVITDYATRWVEAFPTPDMKASTVAKVLISEIICRHSAPKELLSDRGRSFLNKVVEEMCDYFRIKKLNTTAYNPRCNGLTERFNATLCQMLSAYCDAKQTDWDVYLPVVLFAHRTSWQKTVKESPFRLLYGRNPRLPSDIDQWCPTGQFTTEIDQAWKLARDSILKGAEKSKARAQAEQINKKKVSWKVGDSVRLNNPVTRPGLKEKLRGDKWIGPFIISKVGRHNTEIIVKNKPKIVNSSRVKPAEPPRSSRFGRVYKQVDRLGTNHN